MIRFSVYELNRSFQTQNNLAFVDDFKTEGLAKRFIEKLPKEKTFVVLKEDWSK